MLFSATKRNFLLSPILFLAVIGDFLCYLQPRFFWYSRTSDFSSELRYLRIYSYYIVLGQMKIAAVLGVIHDRIGTKCGNVFTNYPPLQTNFTNLHRSSAISVVPLSSI